MPMTPPSNRRIVLASRPSGLPTEQNFRLEEAAIPDPTEGQLLLRTLYLSLDPYMRNMMDEVAPVYSRSLQPGEVIAGGTVSRVVSSRHPRFKPGELVLANSGWQDYAISDGQDLVAVENSEQPSLALGGLGMPGFTAYVGLLDIGQPKAGETLVVSAATGAVGAVVGQIGKIHGMRVVGIAGGAEKCRYAVNELGYVACLDRLELRDTARLTEALSAACPNGIDVYFENVGGAVLDAVLPLLNVGARAPLIGFISHYNERSPPGPDRLPNLLSTVLQKRVRLQGMIILDHYGTRFEDFSRDMRRWIGEGRVKLREDRVNGLEQAPRAFIGLLQGHNFGKVVVEV